MKVNLTSFGLPRSESEESQDSFHVKAWDETVIAVLADGVGGARAGKQAAEKIVHSLVSNYEARPRTWSPPKALAEFTRLVNRTLYQDSMARFGAPEMVSTLSVAVIESNRLYGLNVGDSRVYLSRDGDLRQLSEDHVEEPERFQHVLSRAIGLAPEVEPHCFELELTNGDVALLCSDGVTNVLDPETLRRRLRQGCPARSLVSTVRERATVETADDASAIVLEIAEIGTLQAVRELPLRIPSLLEKGDEIDGFVLERPFHHSDRAWLAVRDGQRYTLKFPPVEARSNEAVLTQFVKESWNATRIRGDAFVRAFVPEDATTRFYAMEFVEAPTLKTLLGSRKLAIDEAIGLGKFLLKAGEELLRLDLVHGDIKPENILVLSGYDRISFKLIDLGSATELFSITTRAGTASYLAPERFREAPISERTEVFAIGVTLFEALTRAFPFGEIERFQTPHFTAARKPSRLNPNIPPWLESVLLRAIAPEPERRYQNYSEMLFDLEHPDKVEPFHAPGAPWIERDPLRFYRAGFFILLAVTFALLIALLSK